VFLTFANLTFFTLIFVLLQFAAIEYFFPFRFSRFFGCTSWQVLNTRGYMVSV